MYPNIKKKFRNQTIDNIYMVLKYLITTYTCRALTRLITAVDVEIFPKVPCLILYYADMPYPYFTLS